MTVSNPKKPATRHEPATPLSQEELERQLTSVAASLTAGRDPGDSEEELQPCWIEPRHLIRIVAPFVSMN